MINKISVDGKTIYFHKNNLIESKKNSSGKTTFLRIILYSLGWNIPSTKGIDFTKKNTSIYFNNNQDNFKFNRNGNNMIIFKNDKFMGEFDTKNDFSEIVSFYTGITQPQLIDNVLGVFYFDQEKGWTLLNRGVVIGSNQFKLETFIEGLMGIDQSNLRNKLKDNLHELNGYKILKKSMEYQDIINEDEYNVDWNSFDEINSELRDINIDINSLKSQINSLRESIKDNERFLNMVIGFGLRVKTDSGDELTVNRQNIVDFDDNQEIIEARISILMRYYNNLCNKKAKIEKKMNDQNKLFDINSQLDRFNESVNKLNVDVNTINSIINNLKSENNSINNRIKDSLKLSNYSISLYKTILRFAQFLGVDKYLDTSKDFMYTTNLKRYSGAILHLLVFSFHMSYLYMLQDKMGMTYPIIIDSPFGKEVTTHNVSLMYKLIREYFPDNQVITASIEDISDFTDIDNKIIFHENMMSSLSNKNNKL